MVWEMGVHYSILWSKVAFVYGVFLFLFLVSKQFIVLIYFLIPSLYIPLKNVQVVKSMLLLKDDSAHKQRLADESKEWEWECECVEYNWESSRMGSCGTQPKKKLQERQLIFEPIA